MSEINRIRVDQYKHIQDFKSHLHASKHQKTIKIDFKQDYVLSSKIEQHIKTSNNDYANQSIRFLDSSMNINTGQKTLGLKLSFIINTKLLDNDQALQPQNYKILLNLDALPYNQEEGVFNDSEGLLFKQINKLVKVLYEYTGENKMSLDALTQNPVLVASLLDTKREQLSFFLNDIIALLYAKGKFKGTGKPGFIYDRINKENLIHIPYFNLIADSLKMDLQINEQQGAPVVIGETNTKNPVYTVNVFQNWMNTGKVFLYKQLLKRSWGKRLVEKQIGKDFQESNSSGRLVSFMSFIIVILLVIIILLI